MSQSLSIDGNAITSLSSSTLRSKLAPIVLPSNHPRARFSNWAKTFDCLPGLVFMPTSVEDLVHIVTLAHRSSKQLRAAGAGHSPSDLACVDSKLDRRTSEGRRFTDEEEAIDRRFEEDGGWMVRMDLMNHVYEIDATSSPPTIHVQAGIFLHELHQVLSSHSPPLAMSNVGSISDQTLAGIVSTASHGSGWEYGVMSEMIEEMHICLVESGAGEKGAVRVVKCSREENRELFLASLCGLGMTGLIVSLKLQVEPAFRLRETKMPMSFDDLVAAPAYTDEPVDIDDNEEMTGGPIDEIARSAEHVRLWWYPQMRGVVVSRSNRTQDPARPPSGLSPHINHFFIFHVTQFLLFIALYFRNFTHLVGKWAWWWASKKSEDVDDGYKVFTFDCLYAQYTTEWSIPYHQTRPCLQALDEWLQSEEANPKGERIHFPIEIRFTKGDDIWLSPSYGGMRTYIGMVQYKPYGLPIPHLKLLSSFSSILSSFAGRPHWAKQHNLTAADFRTLYPMFDNFVKLTREMGGDVAGGGMWGSEYTRRHLGEAAAASAERGLEGDDGGK